MERRCFNLTKFKSHSDGILKALRDAIMRVGETLRVSWKMQGDKFVFTKNMKL